MANVLNVRLTRPMFILSISLISKVFAPDSIFDRDRYTHLRPDYMQSELDRVPDFAVKSEQEVAEFAPKCPEKLPWHDVSSVFLAYSGVVQSVARQPLEM